MNLFLNKIISLFFSDPLVRLVLSIIILIVLLFLVSLLPESFRIKAGIGVIVFVGILNFPIVWGIVKDIFR